MRSVDEKMTTDPLKHEIRVNLWLRYMKRLGKPTVKYLTLYSPAMMDVKLMHSATLIPLKSGMYMGVAGVTNDDDAYTNAVSSGAGRPELVIRADVNEILTKPSSFPQDSQKLLAMFPFDVINLDYCNSVCFQGAEDEVTPHLDAISRVIDTQRRTGGERFALFVTTRAEQGQIAHHFLEELVTRVDRNIESQPEFRKKYVKQFPSCEGGAALLKKHYCEFVPLGIVKFLANLVTANGYALSDCETASIFRDSSDPERWLLHTAIIAEAPGTGSLKRMGNALDREAKVAMYFDRRAQGRLVLLSEKKDQARCMATHGGEIRSLFKQSFEIPIPEANPPEDS